MPVKPIQLRCRPPVGWPTMAGIVPAAPGTAKSRKPHRDWPKSVANPMAPAVLYRANAATASAIRPPNGVTLGLRGNDLLLEA